MLKNIFAKANQQRLGTCFFDTALPKEPVVRDSIDNIPILHPDAPHSQQVKMFSDLYDIMVIKRNQIDPKNGKIIISNVQDKVNNVVDQMFKYQSRYQTVSGKYSTPIKWYHVALLYKLESNEPLAGKTPSFDYYLGNGQSIYRRTTIVPVGRGPFKTWEQGCWDAIEFKGLHLKKDWSIGEFLLLAESFNGTGYRKYHNMQSPYIFSGSNIYVKGKYPSDGKFDKNEVSSQIGVALYYKEIIDRLI